MHFDEREKKLYAILFFCSNIDKSQILKILINKFSGECYNFVINCWNPSGIFLLRSWEQKIGAGEKETG